MREYRPAIIVGGLVVITLLAYLRVVSLHFVNYDDPGYVTSNGMVCKGLTWTGLAWAFTATEQGNWHPLTWMSLMLDVSLFGSAQSATEQVASSAAEHAVNLLFHIGSVILLYWVLRRMTALDWPSAMVAALFAVHPLHVESVAWVAERKDVLSAFLGLLTLAAYIEYARQPSLKRYLLVFAGLALGLMAKPMLVTLPLVFLLLDFWPLKRVVDGWWSVVGERQTKQKRKNATRRPVPTTDHGPPTSILALVLEKLPLLALSVASSIVTYYVQRNAGAMAYSESVPLETRMANVVCSYVVYLRKLFWPVDLAVMYPLYAKPILLATLLAIVFSVALLLAISGLVVWGAARGKSYLAVGWLWYLGMMVPVIGLIQVGGQGMADRYMYLPAIGLYVMLVFGVADMTTKWSNRAWPLGIAASAILIACIALTVRQVGFWHDTPTLYERSIAATPDNPLAQTQYAAYLINERKPAEAIAHCDKAIECAPNYAFAYANKASALIMSLRPDEAIEACRKALKLSPHPKTFYNARIDLAIALGLQGRYDEANREFDAVLSDDPKNTTALLSLAIFQEREGRTAQAIHNYERLLAIDPENRNAKRKLSQLLERIPAAAVRHDLEIWQKNPDDVAAADQIGRAYQLQGKLNEAIKFYYDVLARRPQDIAIRSDLGMALLHAGKTAEGIRELEDVLRVDPRHDRALNTLAWIRATHPFAMIRNGAEAVKYAELAATNNRDNNPGILDTLAAAYAEAGQFDKAVEKAKEAVKIATETHDHNRPDFEAHLKLFEAHKPYHDPLPPGVVDPSPSTPKSSAAAVN